MPTFDPATFLLTILTLVLSITVHEWAHAATADAMGDPTPRLQGRVTLWPGAHLDPVGTILMVISTLIGFGLGWGRPVMTDTRAYTRLPRRLAGFLVVFAGPLSNFVIALVFVQLLRFDLLHDDFYIFFVNIIVRLNLVLFLFNLLPVPPLDGSKLLAYSLPEAMGDAYLRFMQQFGLFFLGLLMFTHAVNYILEPAVGKLFLFLVGVG